MTRRAAILAGAALTSAVGVLMAAAAAFERGSTATDRALIVAVSCVIVRPEKVKTPDGWVMGWAGKKAAGRKLDGITHDGYPASVKGGAA
jgi:hypothetical protein